MSSSPDIKTVTETAPPPPVQSDLFGQPTPPPQQGTPLPTPPQPGAPSPSLPPPTPWVFDAVIDGQTYHLPGLNEPPVEVLLLDGSVGVLHSNKVILRGQTLNIPAGLTSAQEISVGGQTITAQPGPSTNLDRGGNGGDNGGGGGGPLAGLFKGIGKAVGAAGKAVSSVADVGKSAVDFATGTGGAAAGTVANAMGTALGNVNDVVATLNGLRQVFPLDQLSFTALGTFTSAQNLGRGVSNWLTATSNALKGFDSLTPDMQKRVRDNINEFGKPGGEVERAGEAMRAFEEFPWDQEIRQTSAVSSGQPAATGTTGASSDRASPTQTTALTTENPQATTQTTSITSSSKPASSQRPEQTPTPHYIWTKVGTSMDTFEQFIQQLDGSKGDKSIFESFGNQVYLTDLTSEQAASLKDRHDFIMQVYEPSIGDLNDEGPPEEFLAIPTGSAMPPRHSTQSTFQQGEQAVQLTTSSSSRLDRRGMIPASPQTPYWKKMIAQAPGSSSNPSRPPLFIADESGGKGTTIYILDDGFDVDILELASQGRKVEHFVAPNKDTIPPRFLENHQRLFPNLRILPEDIRGVSGHGTKMASIAAGKTIGVAPNADLYLLKTKGAFNRGDAPDRPDTALGAQAVAMLGCLNRIQFHVENRLKVDKDAKSVVNMSFGFPASDGESQHMEAAFIEFFAWAERRRIPVVLAAGNDNSRPLHQGIPRKCGTPDNMIITVGGVQEDGSLYEQTAPDIPNEDGSMTVFAPAAAAITSGLVAYIYGCIGVCLIHDPSVPSPEEDIKKFLVAHAYPRVPLPAAPPEGWSSIPKLNVVYNLANGDTAHPESPCAIHFPKRQDQNVTACSAISTPISSTLSASQSMTSATILTTTTEAAPTSTQIPAATSIASSPPAASPPSDPPKTMCQISVREIDNADPSNHGEEAWKVGISRAGASAIDSEIPFCYRAETTDERAGIEVKCPHLGSSTISVR
ncbi:uncharacterized protein EI97DRAFT_470584 [Westerdykella ornata]|uniref:Peptidase S8/S53 domain-containing protein n=1 Tax=Westerdykella ornata TaxID=318751 RepID=A0A6A6J6Q1_WESOR|nr:uncharacterized protein EI97DRAFT_470584 [Westerdykella ornata]KAF2272251.1 hypothetical protein EI97DRAFT_470584 [Westerdykella ornata]